MTTQEQEMMDQLSNTVTALSLAIDPECKHGPETAKLVEYAKTTRRLALELATATWSNPNYVHNKSKEIRQHLDFHHPTNGDFGLAIPLLFFMLLFSGCRFPGVDQHEGHNYEPNPWHVPTNNPSL